MAASSGRPGVARGVPARRGLQQHYSSNERGDRPTWRGPLDVRRFGSWRLVCVPVPFQSVKQ